LCLGTARISLGLRLFARLIFCLVLLYPLRKQLLARLVPVCELHLIFLVFLLIKLFTHHFVFIGIREVDRRHCASTPPCLKNSGGCILASSRCPGHRRVLGLHLLRSFQLARTASPGPGWWSLPKNHETIVRVTVLL